MGGIGVKSVMMIFKTEDKISPTRLPEYFSEYSILNI